MRTAVVHRERGNLEIGVTHEAVPAGAIRTRHARLQILRVVIKTVARVTDAPGEGHHDREA